MKTILLLNDARPLVRTQDGASCLHFNAIGPRASGPAYGGFRIRTHQQLDS